MNVYQFDYRTYAHHGHAHLTGARLVLDVAATLSEQERQAAETRRLQARGQELGQAIAEHIGYENYCLWVDALPADTDLDARAMIAAMEAKLAALDADAAETIAEMCPTAHANTHPCYDYPAMDECADCGMVVE
jgi:hypothetical protein